MLNFDEAFEHVQRVAPRLTSELVTLEQAHGRVLSEPLHATSPLPAFDYSAMDGYAVLSTAFFGEPPFTFSIDGESRTGRPAPRLGAGSVCRIFTGAQLPDGADAVVMQEDVIVNERTARFDRRPDVGQHVRRAGEDIARGALALDAGTRLGAYQLGLVAALDRGEVRVAKRPRVSILSTGDELRKPGSGERPASIPESNSFVIAALARAVGATVTTLAATSDTLDDTRASIAAALATSDVLVTVGGVSVGDYDVVRPALEAEGVVLELYKVAMKPGKPLTLGRRGETLVLGLPGNPTSAQVTFALFGVPLLRTMQGERTLRSPRRFRLGAPIRQKPGRRGFYTATLDGGVVMPTTGQASGSTVNLAHAQALVIVPEDSSGYDAGETADVLLLSEL
ncbi:MAG TPA: gephyrin-like molybdotransferase Glp [Polyangiaceae bacterium]|jgi:molybdopterin molybdotransferase|nr:gephyrin-like molybdotransferase Glp [Polyangiaceae bacterium]